jgi:hypothetical protein
MLVYANNVEIEKVTPKNICGAFMNLFVNG